MSAPDQPPLEAAAPPPTAASYFRRHYDDLRLPLADGVDDIGLRLSQTGAIHAVAAHFAHRRASDAPAAGDPMEARLRGFEPAIVTMPTGSGKTAVLIALCYLLRAQRVLVLTPSRLVREQIGDEFKTLRVLRAVGALGKDVPPPRVEVIRHRPASGDEWLALRETDVVVAIPASVSPAVQGVTPPPGDFFDVVLVDEAHHSPAHTWQELLDHFVGARRALFTATPFRRDQREIRGRFVYTYDLADAHRDGVFGRISFQPVEETADRRGDAAIAYAAARQLRDDWARGYEHLLMVRTDSMKRAAALADVYESTGLRLEVVTSRYSLRHVSRVIKRLRAHELDGIICVNMLGEGFDLPALKVAAIHAPHRSLAVTLQFIGRFARRGDGTLGPATFLAIPSEIEVEAARLYEETAAWQDLVSNLSATRVASEVRSREVLDSFSTEMEWDVEAEGDAGADVSLYAFKTGNHAKVFRTDGQVDLSRAPELPEGMQVVHREVSEEYYTSVFVTRQVRKAAWSTTGRFVDIVHGLFVVHLHPPSGLLFVSASPEYRLDNLYEDLARQFAGGVRALPTPRLNKVLVGLRNPAFFNIGLRSRVKAIATESYRIIAGSNADQAVQMSDGRTYYRGHVFGRGDDGGQAVTIGFSSSSKVWSTATSRIPALIAWFDRLAEKIAGDQKAQTACNLDYLSAGEEIDRFSAPVVAAEWDIDVFRDPPLVRVEGDGANARSLLDYDLVVETDRSDEERAGILVRGDGIEARFTFSLKGEWYFTSTADDQPTLLLERGNGSLTLLEYLNARPPLLFTADYGVLHGSSYVPPPQEAVQTFDVRRIEPVEWTKHNVDVDLEFDRPDKGRPGPGRCSIHTYLEERLAAGEADVVLYDHGSGEVADFVTITRGDIVTDVVLYHCKGAPAEGGDRVDDAAEVCMQAVKSVAWGHRSLLRAKIRDRLRNRPGVTRFIRGDLATVDALLGDDQRMRVTLHVVLVQPGFSASDLSPKLGSILAAANDYLTRANFNELRVLGSR
jgi:superfamily II DNA or RNA helicase